MNATPGLLAAAKKLESAVKGFQLEAGEHEVSEQFLIEVKGTIKKSKDTDYQPTTSLPFKIICALLVEKCGIVGDAAVKMITEAMKEALDLSTDTSAQDAVEQKCKNLALAEERVQAMLGALPKRTRSGQTSMKNVEVRIQPIVPELV